jgi:hypothetical protein
VLATAGAADPSGPFGRGRLNAGVRVTWLWCHVTMRNGGCPHTLALSVRRAGGALIVNVRQYDDHGKAKPGAGATVHAGSRTATTGPGGSARLSLPRGRYRLFATQAGRIRSFPVGAEVT